MNMSTLKKTVLAVLGLGISAGAYYSGSSIATEAPVTTKTLTEAETSDLSCPTTNNTNQVYFVGCGGFF